jgi:hypothetical protein
MLHDAVMSRTSAGRAGTDRRESDRLPFPAEMIVVWNHDLDTTLRYQVIDAGDGGYRIRTSLPMLEGTTGMVLRMLPGRGRSLDQPVMVAWSRKADEAAGFDVGLRCF